MGQDTNQNTKLRLPSVAFLVCIVLSGLAWCITNFSRDQEQTFEYKLTCSSLPEGKKTCTLSDSTMVLTFQTRGLNYLTNGYSEENRIVDLPVAELIASKPKRSAYTFSNKELLEFLQEKGYTDLKTVQKPEVLTIYIR